MGMSMVPSGFSCRSFGKLKINPRLALFLRQIWFLYGKPKKIKVPGFYTLPIKIIVFLLLHVNNENLNAGYVYFCFHCVLTHKLLLTISTDSLHKTYRPPSLSVGPVRHHDQINLFWLPLPDCGRNCWRQACVRTDSLNVSLNSFSISFPSPFYKNISFQ